MAYRSSSTNSGNSATPSVAVPTGVQIGDIVLIGTSIDNSSAVFDSGDYPTGFTELHDVDVTADGHSVSLSWKRLTAADSGTYTFGDLGASGDWVCQAVAFSGRHATDPPVSTSNVSNTASSSPQTVTGTGVTAVAGDDLAWWCAPDVTSSGAFNSLDAPTNFTERQETENAWTTLHLSTRDNVGAGATGNITSTLSHNDNSGWAVFVVRIPEAAAGDQTVSPSSIASAETFGTPSVKLNITGTGIASSEAFGTPSVKLNISTTGISSTEAFGTPSLTLNITATGIPSAEAFGTPTVSNAAGTQTITAVGIPSAEAFGVPVVTGGAVTEVAFNTFMGATVTLSTQGEAIYLLMQGALGTFPKLFLGRVANVSIQHLTGTFYLVYKEGTVNLATDAGFEFADLPGKRSVQFEARDSNQLSMGEFILAGAVGGETARVLVFIV